MNPFILIVGPTGAGKSALALKLAQVFQAGILNCDSLQVYRRLDIGTAKPTPDERKLVPHFLFDVLGPNDVLSAGDFRRMALEVLARELPVRPVIGVGGSGFYIQALEKGMFDIGKPAPEIDKQVRTECRQMGLERMYSQLRDTDPAYAERISPNDEYRILRALIIMRDSGQTVSELQKRFASVPIPFPYPLLKMALLPERETLAGRIQKRTRAMLAAGFVEEVRSLMDDGLSLWPPLQSVGYKECVKFLNGEISEADLSKLIFEKTMQLAKKQKTWFKRDSNTHLLPTDEPSSFEAAQVLISRFLDSLR